MAAEAQQRPDVVLHGLAVIEAYLDGTWYAEPSTNTARTFGIAVAPPIGCSAFYLGVMQL